MSSGLHVRLELVPGHRLEHRVDVLHEVERLGVEEHVLLLDAERVRLALAELVVEDAAAGGEALARDRGGIDLLHDASMASASISTYQRGSRRPRDDAGRGRADLAEDLAVRARDARPSARPP